MHEAVAPITAELIVISTSVSVSERLMPEVLMSRARDEEVEATGSIDSFVNRVLYALSTPARARPHWFPCCLAVGIAVLI